MPKGGATVGAVNISFVRQLILGQSQRQPAFPNAKTEVE